MHYKTNRQNHDFQILHFLVGSCHTPDGAYALLCDLREDRSNALKMAQAGTFKEEAKKLAEIEAMLESNRNCVLAAQDELAYIEQLMERLEPHRLHRDLPLRQAHEAAQAEEWRLELIYRAENFLLTQRSIPTDHFATMRMHPAFKDSIWPEVQRIEQEILSNNRTALNSRVTGKAQLEDVLLLAS